MIFIMNAAGNGGSVQHRRWVMARVNEDTSTNNTDAVFGSPSLLPKKECCEQKRDAQDENANSA